MPVTADYLHYVLEQLARVHGLTSRRMFGGYGLYSDDAFFGLIDDDTLFLKTSDSNRADYESRGMKRFMPSPGQTPSGGGMGYHEVPADVLEDAEQLATWARKSVEIAVSRAAARHSKSARKRVTATKKKTRRTVRRRSAAKR
jgi:DNA transformation protein and related proteins